ncbi:MAG: hypothetical protein Q9218_002384 [Villophora microphyllina]
MAEIVGAVAGVIALSQAVMDSANCIYELFKAPTEIKNLQEQLKAFCDVVESIEATIEATAQKPLHSALCIARKVMEELHELITVKLIGLGSSSGRARRRAWLRNKRNIVRLHDKLKDVRETLLGAICTDLLSSTCRVESTLTAISQQWTSSRMTHDEDDQQTKDTSNLRHSAQARSMIISFMRKSPKTQPSSSEAPSFVLRPPMGTFGHILEESDHQDTDPMKLSEASTCAPQTTSVQARQFHKSLARQPISTSSFERLPSFRPETYTSDVPVILFSYYNREIAATEYNRVNQCTMFYSHASRLWARLTVSITTSIESKYWDLGKVKYIDPKRAYPLPKSLIADLQAFLQSRQNVEQDAHLSIYLGNQSTPNRKGKVSSLPVHFIKPPFQAKTYLQNITSMIKHMGCPHYLEKDLVHRPLHRIRPNNCFITHIGSRWVSEQRFGSDKSQIDSQLYIMQVLHCLQGTPGISPFVGVVQDERTSIINAFLSELPAKGKIFGVLTKARKSGRPVPWERRKRWCRQIVRAVAEMHSKGFVVGFLGERPICGIAIDAKGMSRREQLVPRDESAKFALCFRQSSA